MGVVAGGVGACPRNKFEGADYLSPPPDFVSRVGLYLEKMSLNHKVLPIEDLMQEFIDRSTVRLNMFHPGNVMLQDSQI